MKVNTNITSMIEEEQFTWYGHDMKMDDTKIQKYL